MRATCAMAGPTYTPIPLAVRTKKPRETQSLTGHSGGDVMRAAGFEPTTSCSGGKRSIQLSYARRTLARLGVAGTAPEPLSLTPGCDRHKELALLRR